MAILYINQEGQEATLLEAYLEAAVLMTILGRMLPATCRDQPLPAMDVHFRYKDDTDDTVIDSIYLRPVQEEQS